jgi:outer membrane murein-binding lipoprotein Lpp
VAKREDHDFADLRADVTATPPSPLFQQTSIGQAPGITGPARRRVWPIVLFSVLLTALLLALAGGGYAAYHSKTNQVSELKAQRDDLQTTSAVLTRQLATARGKLHRANARLTATAKGLNLAKKNLTKMQKDLVAANERADANYNAGYGAGNSSGYSSGVSAGLVEGSDSLTCSDDPDVDWLPYCNP